MKVVATSDTHFPFDSTLIPDGDVFVHAGDILMEGTMHEWMLALESLKALPHKHKILVPGNHDFFIMENAKAVRKQLEKEGIVLLDDISPTTCIDGVVFGGIPFVTNLPAWAYNRLNLSIEEHFDKFPELFGADVLITHAPMYKVLDDVPHYGPVGCLVYERMYKTRGLNPKHWICGHIHEGYGYWKDSWCGYKSLTTFWNASMCDKKYKQVNPAWVFDTED